MKNKKDCPICSNLIYRIDLSLHVCKKHETTYFITECTVCEKYCYSKVPSLCKICEIKQARKVDTVLPEGENV